MHRQHRLRYRSPRRLVLLLVTPLLLCGAFAAAASDSLQSLFNFQTRMAAQGNPEAMIKLGEMYEEGFGVEKSVENARLWYQRALDNGHPDAQAHLHQLQGKEEQAAKGLAAKEQVVRAQSAKEPPPAGRGSTPAAAMSAAEKARAREEAMRRAEAIYQRSLEQQIERERAESERLRQARGATAK